jgi:hypothetical protein
MGCSSSGSLGLRFAGRWDVLLICFTPALYQHAVSSSPIPTHGLPRSA